MDSLKEFQSLGKFTILDSENYSFWKVKTMNLIKGIDEDAWSSVEEGWSAPIDVKDGKEILKSRFDWTPQENRASALSSKAITIILNTVDNVTPKIRIPQYDLGAALAALFPTVLAIHGEDELLDRCEGVYTFGQPRVGDEQFGEFMKGVMNKHGIKYKRFVYCNDLVPRIPFDDTMLFGFKHYGPCIYFNTLYKGRVCEDQPNKNYFSILWFIPKLLTAVWELIRSFIIPFWKGKDFKENWLMRLIRVMGLLLPGASDHFPCDYVTSMRLGGLPKESPDEKLSLIV
ncbi:PREDICTED: uncharacterized protein LOC104820674 [Tarenaya hassleriana]|uniref:uncharacterized protein LOC104820674 n=1 Tax=Tarenaya hassleriana TaxID=28532 RepID=UPI00053C9018|nr:PREDICTED: uncharacterized protein LOC104820674 [Tarenaya hassleriana]